MTETMDIAIAEAGAISEDWAGELRDWVDSLGAGADMTPAGWHLTDLRHLGNLQNPARYGLDSDAAYAVADAIDYGMADLFGVESIWD